MLGNLTEDQIIEFVSSCLKRGRVLWTYHVSMRLRDRYIPRGWILESADKIEVVEIYSDDRYLPSCLLLGKHLESVFHFVVAMDFPDDFVTIITAYRPDPSKWEHNWRIRRKA
jgi:hypothetical protein